MSICSLTSLSDIRLHLKYLIPLLYVLYMYFFFQLHGLIADQQSQRHFCKWKANFQALKNRQSRRKFYLLNNVCSRCFKKFPSLHLETVVRRLSLNISWTARNTRLEVKRLQCWQKSALSCLEMDQVKTLPVREKKKIIKKSRHFCRDT